MTLSVLDKPADAEAVVAYLTRVAQFPIKVSAFSHQDDKRTWSPFWPFSTTVPSSKSRTELGSLWIR
jgi:hypothetical protein